MDFNTLIAFRKVLHQYPEVSGNEHETARRVVDFLTPCTPSRLLTHVGGTGIIATWEGEAPGPEILIRAELDALPITEINDFSYKSNYEGVSHKCGHDGHATILCGVAAWLSANLPQKGKVHLLFQAAEENGEGAKAMLNDVRFQSINPDRVYALHNLPGFPLHAVVVKNESFTAAVNSIIIKLWGKTSHAAEPEHGLNPAIALAEIVTDSLALAHNVPADKNMRVVTPVYMNLGEKAYGISAGFGELHLTVRCWDNDNLHQLEKEIERVATSVAQQHQLQIELSYTQSFFANQNDALAVGEVRLGAKHAGLQLIEKDYPFKWGEDFGLFTNQFKGAMFGLGSGENCPALHNPDYDFPDELIATGVKIFTSIIKQHNY